MIEFLRGLFRPYLELKRAIVNLKSGTVFRGVIYSDRGAWLAIRQAELINDRGTPFKQNSTLDGEVLVAKHDIDFIQVVR